MRWARTSDDDRQLSLPVELMAHARALDRLTGADERRSEPREQHRSTGWLGRPVGFGGVVGVVDADADDPRRRRHRRQKFEPSSAVVAERSRVGDRCAAGRVRRRPRPARPGCVQRAETSCDAVRRRPDPRSIVPSLRRPAASFTGRLRSIRHVRRYLPGSTSTASPRRSIRCTCSSALRDSTDSTNAISTCGR